MKSDRLVLYLNERFIIFIFHNFCYLIDEEIQDIYNEPTYEIPRPWVCFWKPQHLRLVSCATLPTRLPMYPRCVRTNYSNCIVMSMLKNRDTQELVSLCKAKSKNMSMLSWILKIVFNLQLTLILCVFWHLILFPVKNEIYIVANNQ